MASYRRAVSELPVQLVMMHPVVRAEFTGVVRHSVVSETTDVGGARAARRHFRFAHGFRPDAIVSFDECGVNCAAVLSGRFGLRTFTLARRGADPDQEPVPRVARGSTRSGRRAA